MKELTKEDKKLLFKDLSARVPYGVKVKKSIPLLLVSVRNDWGEFKVVSEGTYNEHIYNIEDIRPYLRPMSDMTEEEKVEYKHLVAFSGSSIGAANFVDWLNAHHFDYRGLIEKGLAIAVTDENNPYKNE